VFLTVDVSKSISRVQVKFVGKEASAHEDVEPQEAASDISM
jgi:hypothetical protein